MRGSLETISATSGGWEHIMKKCLSISIAIILALSAPGIAKATLSVTAQVGGVPSMSGATLETFNEVSPSILTVSGSAYLVMGTAGDETYTAPFFSGGTAAFFGESPTYGPDNSQYVAVEGGGSATLSFSTPQNYLGLLWGSGGSGNVLTFYDSEGNVIDSPIRWSDIPGVPPEGGYDADGTYYVNINSTTAFSSVVATDASDAFEFDDVAYGQAVPEPTTMLAGALLLLPFGANTLRIVRKGRTA